MEELIIFIIQLVFEAILPNLDWMGGVFPNGLRTKKGNVSIEAAICWLIVGGLLGMVWAHAYPHYLLKYPLLRIANLVIGPWIAASISYRIARRQIESNPIINPRARFWYSYWLALSLIASHYGYVADFVPHIT